MVDHAFTDTRLAGLYDALNPWGRGDDFYLGLVHDAGAVLDVGCGTGALLARAREEGHTGRLCGLDPAPGMLAVARRRQDVEWTLGALPHVRPGGAFDLVVMNGHAFQVWVDDAEIRASLAAVRELLAPGGRFAFETRNPAGRAWESWTPDRAVEVDGVRVGHEVVAGFDGRTVTFDTTFRGAGWRTAEVSRSTLRFLTAGELDGFLAEAGLVVESRWGDWDRSPVTASSPEILSVCRVAEQVSKAAAS
ncbi:class I SAM-dependent methyltransferase [Streptomyces sp. SID14478]|uniref:class I SAM-dependent methyltransferase n=1 Tax=Streptomyces sp. SID14478 TaxID=2706073 RepID=UPI0013DEF3C1|nr:class I SAM-dependent methyltransferase [Streptomyces sp. SID14478]NEB80704.1 class I SAM-dependent methyltransferase [Streptomyces sp. SID14478]